MQGGGDAVRYHYEDKAMVGGGDGEVEEAVAEPVPEYDLAEKFEVAVPPCRSFAGGLGREQSTTRIGCRG